MRIARRSGRIHHHHRQRKDRSSLCLIKTGSDSAGFETKSIRKVLETDTSFGSEEVVVSPGSKRRDTQSSMRMVSGLSSGNNLLSSRDSASSTSSSRNSGPKVQEKKFDLYTKQDHAYQGMTTTLDIVPKKRLCMKPQKDVTFQIPHDSDGLKALTNASDGLRLQQEECEVSSFLTSSGGKGMIHGCSDWEQSRGTLATIHMSNKLLSSLKKKKKTQGVLHKVGGKASSEEVAGVENMTRTFQMLGRTGVSHPDDKQQWLTLCDNEDDPVYRSSITLRPLTTLPYLVQTGTVKCSECQNVQNRIKMLELKDSDSSKLQGQIHALEKQMVKMEQQNGRFQERNEALESRLVAFEVEQMKQRRTIKVLENRIAQVGCPLTGASFLPVLSLGRKSVHANRVTAQNMA
ncbi:unnamed protein product [Sphagnum jensenii]|uniref:Uncharacterized protein n=1 Tax=Sphagnum jensenii TaxID=128206 RepID=A0ABP0X9Z8_9BRYO